MTQPTQQLAAPTDKPGTRRLDRAELQRRAGNLVRGLEAAGVDQASIVSTLRQAARLLAVLTPTANPDQQRALELVRTHVGGSDGAGHTPQVFAEALRQAQANGRPSATEAGKSLYEQRKAGAR